MSYVPKKADKRNISLSQIDVIDYSHVSDLTSTTTSGFTHAVPSNYLRCENYAYFYYQVYFFLMQGPTCYNKWERNMTYNDYHLP